MKRWIAAAAGVAIGVAATVEGILWWRNTHPQFPEHETVDVELPAPV